jgi:putative lipoprotein
VPTPEPTVALTPAPTPVLTEAPATTEAPALEDMVSGFIAMPMGAILPEDAVVTVEIEDVSIADAPAEIIAEAHPVLADLAASEIPFEIAYEPSRVDAAKTYAVRAVIEDAAGTLLYISDTSTPVITGDSPTTEVEVAVVPAAATSPAPTITAVGASPEPS